MFRGEMWRANLIFGRLVTCEPHDGHICSAPHVRSIVGDTVNDIVVGADHNNSPLPPTLRPRPRPHRCCRYLPFVGQLVGGWIFKKLAFVFELASNFMAAHEDIAILELLPEGERRSTTAFELAAPCDVARTRNGNILSCLPSVDG